MWIVVALGVLGVVGLGLARSARASQQSGDDGAPATPATTSPNASSVPPSAPTTTAAKPPSGPSTVGSGVYHTAPEDAELDPTGWVSTAVGEVTALPLRDRRTGLFARLTYRDAVAAAKLLGGELLSEREQDAIALEGVMLDPCTLPPTAQMASVEWAQRHDRCLTDQLHAIAWDRASPVNNAGKDWIRGAAPGRALNRGWYAERAPNGQPRIADGHFKGGRPPAARLIQTTGGAHNDGHTDYSQLTRLVRREAA